METTLRIRFIGLKELKRKADRGTTTIYTLRKTDPKFPKPIKFGGKNAWLEHEVDAWILELVEASRTDAPAPAVTAIDAASVAPPARQQKRNVSTRAGTSSFSAQVPSEAPSMRSQLLERRRAREAESK
jgi:predicted DNA-binding transcriptional regulator AlpA